MVVAVVVVVVVSKRQRGQSSVAPGQMQLGRNQWNKRVGGRSGRAARQYPVQKAGGRRREGAEGDDECGSSAGQKSPQRRAMFRLYGTVDQDA